MNSPKKPIFIAWNSISTNSTNSTIDPTNPTRIDPKNFPIVAIKARNPYYTEYMYNKYGGLNSILGSNLQSLS